MKNSRMTPFVICGLIVVLTLILLANMPKRVVKVDDKIKLESILGCSKMMPESDIEIISSPFNRPSKLIRVFGIKIGDRMSGLFHDRNNRKTIRLYITGNTDVIFFKHKSHIYMTDSWMK